MGQQNIPFPSFIDAIYITMYPVLAVGLLLLARKRVPGGDRASLIDALTSRSAWACCRGSFLIGPNVRGPGTLLVRLTAAAYPLGDVLVLAMLAHLWSAGGFRTPRAAAGHRDRGDAGLRLALRVGQPARRAGTGATAT
jgi:hypothetical protein